jgi:lipopolysaccharide/colanic/teichoic acid biosynthesis glycosyltransferase
MKRFFDIAFSAVGIILLFPLFLVLSLFILLDSKGGVFYRQVRVGKDGKDFKLLKFRSMAVGSDKKGLLTVGGNDSRITRSGFYLRKFKLDELPQLFNVLKGEMSLVGPRPEVRKYVNLYSPGQLKVLKVRPGITDYASIEYADENELLSNAENPEEFYIQEVMPAKLQLNKKYIDQNNLMIDLKIIFKTIGKITSR